VHRGWQLSIDSIDSAVAASLVGVSDFVKRVDSSARNLIGAGIIPRIKSVITPYNFRNVGELVRSFADLGVAEFHVGRYDRTFYRHREEHLLSESQEAVVRDSLRKIVQDYQGITVTGNLGSDDLRASNKMEMGDTPPTHGTSITMRKLHEMVGCSAGRTSVGILPNGKACLCEQMVMQEPFIFGDFSKQSIIEIWNSPQLREICFPARAKYTNNSCSNCEDFEYCIIHNGQCFRDNFMGRNPDGETGNPFRQHSNCYKIAN
jgi:radical SAM protein with 4Fe4S-binding SPASM domain